MQASILQAGRHPPAAPSGPWAKGQDEKKGKASPPPPCGLRFEANSQAVEQCLVFLAHIHLLRPDLLPVAPGAGEHRRTILEALDTLLK